MIENGRVKNHSGEGAFWGNLIAWAVCFIVFVACLYAMSFWSLESVWIPGVIAMVLAVVALIIPKQILGRGDSVDEERIHARHTAVQHHSH